MISSVCKTYNFSAAHQLPNHNGKCKNEHGHNYKVEIEVSGPINTESGHSSEGMVVDFQDLDAVMDLWIRALDHQNLNKLGLFSPTTAENIALFLFNHIMFMAPYKLEQIRVWETDKCWAEVRA